MNWYRRVLWLLTVPVLVALAAWQLGDDAGYVLIEHGNTSIELTLVTAGILLLLIGLVSWLLVRLLRWPFRFWSESTLRRGQQRFLDGTLALASGRPLRAEQQFRRASQIASLRLPALISAHAAAHARADRGRETELIEQLATAPQTARLAAELQAQNALVDGTPQLAIDRLLPLEQSGQLSPFGTRLLVESLCACKRARETQSHLNRIRQSQQMADAEWTRFEARTLAQAVAETSDAINLHALWSDLNREQKRLPDVALAYARRAVQLNLIAQAAVELEATLKHGWSASLVLAYGVLPPDAKAPARLKTAEAWLETHADDAALYLTLGSLARQERHWIKNEDYLRRGLALEPEPSLASKLWRELGRAYAEQGDAERAARALGNALCVPQGERPQKLLGKHRPDDLLAPLPVAEVRDDMGIPRLPGKRNA